LTLASCFFGVFRQLRGPEGGGDLLEAPEGRGRIGAKDGCPGHVFEAQAPQNLEIFLISQFTKF
jgi:hypothetical protein